MALPPFEAGGSHDTVAWALPAVAETSSGGPGVVAGVTALEGADAGPAPAALVAITVNV